ncbi:Multi antimicrobial extrusion protein [Macleaya cordata]|uniref:Protein DETOXIFICATION n=1 Tax=Macleaya cordata TaxID=56857 RepID=A0A200PWM4_MACCD|nr:Multi antimicrobial extrusion protein [Macleaya cordata]
MLGGDHNQKHTTMPEVIEELKRIKDIAFPIAAMSLVTYLKGIISVVCMGRLGRLDLAGGALAIGFTNITGYSVLAGLAMGMDPLCSQAFGSRNLTLVSITLQRTILILLCASIPIALLWLNLEHIMLRLHQNPDIAHVASLYCRYALPDLIANSLLHPLRIYLRSKGTPWPLFWCTLLGVLVHLPITILLAFNLGLGVPGVAISTFVTNFNILIFILGYMYFYTRPPPSDDEDDDHDQQDFLFTTSPLLFSSSPLSSSSPSTTATTLLSEEWWILLRLALSSCLAVCLEWWWYEFMTLLAGYINPPHVTLAASAIVIQTTSLMYTLPTSLSASVSTRVGNELGAGRPSKARLSTMIAIILAVLVSILGFLWTTLARVPWGRVFTQDSEVLKLTVAVLPIIGLCELANCPQTTGCGVLRGTARPTVGAGINLYSFYLVGAPVAIFLAFVMELGFVGLCYGLLAAQIVCAFSIITVICKTDWERESLKAKDLVGRGQGSI